MKTSIKRIAALLLALAVMIPVGIVGVFADETNTETTTTPAYTATEGWGPNADGIFEIATPGDLLAFAAKRTSNGNYKGKTVVLTADIDMNPGWDASTKTAPTNVWANMFYMDGTLDGQGHTIKGIYVNSATDNAVMFVLGQNGSTITNLKIENSYFHATKNAAGVFAAARGPKPITFENVYVDAICEAEDGYAAGFVSFFNATTEAKLIPSVIMNNCVFAGTVTASKAAAGFVGTNNKPATNQGGGMYDVTLTDCANYGTITSATENMAAAFVGNCANEATLTRCYNAGNVATALVNVHLSEGTNNDNNPVNITLEDCYYLATASTVAMTKALNATATVTLKYDGAVATEAKTATVAELLAKDAFKKSTDYLGWVASADSTRAYPVMVNEILVGHDYGDGVVTAPTCAADGYTTYTCKNCGYSYVGDTVKAIDHTPGDWIVDTEATEDFAGKKHQECSVCHKELDVAIIPALPATETTAADTTAADTTAPETTAPATEPTKGCGSSIALGSALGMVSIIGLGAVALGKKRR